MTDRVEPLEAVPLPDPGAPLPEIRASELALTLRYYVCDPLDPLCTIHFDGAFAHRRGPPNDEALHGHPLARRGLEPYGVFEVHDSSWIAEMERWNRVHPYHRPAAYAALRHLVFTFHDEMFECAARGLRWTVEPGGARPRTPDYRGDASPLRSRR